MLESPQDRSVQVFPLRVKAVLAEHAEKAVTHLPSNAFRMKAQSLTPAMRPVWIKPPKSKRKRQKQSKVHVRGSKISLIESTEARPETKFRLRKLPWVRAKAGLKLRLRKRMLTQRCRSQLSSPPKQNQKLQICPRRETSLPTR